MKKIMTILVLLGFSNVSWGIFWTAKPAGVLTTASGKVAVHLNSTPIKPNPASSTWEACKDNFVYFHQNVEGEAIIAERVDRMLSVALSAFKTGASLRLNIIRNAENECFSSQMYDLGS